MRLRMLKDDRDFCPGSIRTEQSGPDVLAICSMMEGTGDFHPHLDKPADGFFKASDLRLRLELTASDASAEMLAEKVWSLKADGMRATLTLGASLFNGEPVVWTSGIEGGKAFVDGICKIPSSGGFKVEELKRTFIAFALSLAPDSALAEPQKLDSDPETGKAAWPSKGLSLAI